jgi:hypothetical protein
MDAQLPRDQNDLSEIERRLAAWQPKSDGLRSDAMLFAAGFAAGRRGPSRLWQAVCALLLVQVVGLAVWLSSERSQRLALASQSGQGVSVPTDATRSASVNQSPFVYVPLPNDYLHQRRRWEQDENYHLAMSIPPRPGDVEQEFPQAAILRAGQWSALLD